MDDDYKITPQAYLTRCRERLLEETKQALFYAAVELRCCVEARLAEYFEHHENLKHRRFQPYRLGENQRTVSKIAAGDVISRVTFRLADGTALRNFHTPVPLTLQDYVKRSVDDLRHCQPHYRRPDDPWWSETRNGLIAAYRAAWISCRGEMPLPPLWDRDTGETHPVIIYHTEQNKAAMKRFTSVTNAHVDVRVEYLEAPPANWRYDL
jgi:hypothetical protein